MFLHMKEFLFIMSTVYPPPSPVLGRLSEWKMEGRIEFALQFQNNKSALYLILSEFCLPEI